MIRNFIYLYRLIIWLEFDLISIFWKYMIWFLIISLLFYLILYYFAIILLDFNHLKLQYLILFSVNQGVTFCIWYEYFDNSKV